MLIVTAHLFLSGSVYAVNVRWSIFFRTWAYHFWLQWWNN